jgi:small basic protein
MLISLRKTRLRLDARVATLISVLGGLLYLGQSWVYAHTQASLLDEGAYLVKGYLFATGVYRPYQDYGLWTNHMPLAFLVPGYAEALFGPGLRTGRYLAILFGCLIVLGLWIVTRRMGGKWWAAIAVWVLALNPAVIKLYSLANSQALLACMLVWIMVLTLGESQPLWQILVGSALAGAILVTRVNLAPVLIFLLAYLFWQHGWRMAGLAFVAGILPVLIGHALYWPGILKIWAHWLPLKLFPFLRAWGNPPGSDPTWQPVVTTETRVLSFFQGIRFHFTALVAALAAWLLWLPRNKWPSASRYKDAVFVSGLLAVLILAHMWAALGKDYCVFCFPVYLSFFSFLGLILFAICISALIGAGIHSLPAWRQAAAGLAVIVLLTGIGYGTFTEVGGGLLPVLDISVPRMQAMRFLPGRVPLGTLFQNKLGLSDAAFEQLARRILPAIAGLTIGIVLVILSHYLSRFTARRFAPGRASFGVIALLSTLLLGMILSPTLLLGGGYNTYDCQGDVIQGYENAGQYLAEVIPPGSLVYWRGGNSSVPLLYIKNVRIFPAQINGDYSLRKGGDPDELVKFGFWSESLAQVWSREADYILIEERLFNGWLSQLVEAGGYDEIRPTPSTVICRNNASIHIYRRKR